MKTFDYINFTIDHLFKTNNERQILKAYFYRKTLNMTPREVGKELKLSRNQVNNLNTARLYKLSEESNLEFRKNHLEASKRIEKVVMTDIAKRHSKHIRHVYRRFNGNHRLTTIGL